MARTGPYGLCLPLQALPLPAGLSLCPGLLLEGPDLPGQGPGQDGGSGPHHPGLPHPGTGSAGSHGGGDAGGLCAPAPREHRSRNGSSMASVRPLSPGCQLDPSAEVAGGPTGRGTAAPHPTAGTAQPGGEDQGGLGWGGDGCPGLPGQGSPSCPGPRSGQSPPLSPCLPVQDDVRTEIQRRFPHRRLPAED